MKEYVNTLIQSIEDEFIRKSTMSKLYNMITGDSVLIEPDISYYQMLGDILYNHWKELNELNELFDDEDVIEYINNTLQSKYENEEPFSTMDSIKLAYNVVKLTIKNPNYQCTFGEHVGTQRPRIFLKSIN